MSEKRRPALATVATLLTGLPGIAAGGPPMITEDTSTTAAGVTELIVYVAGEKRDSRDSAEMPGVDVTYGLNDSLEISMVIPWQYIDEPGESADHGWGTAVIGTKWRFFEEDGWAFGFGPYATLPLSNSAAVRGIVADTYALNLPLLGSYRRGRLELNANLSYAISSGDFESVFYGTSAGIFVNKQLRLLGEVWGFDFIEDDSRNGFTNWRIGLEWSLAESATLLAAFGGRLSSQLVPEDQLDSDFYLGLQYAIGR